MTPGGVNTAVLLATCNGAPFLRQQLASIFGQEGMHLDVLVRDDASTDATPAMLDALEREWPQVSVLRDARGRLGYAQNFSTLMAAALERGYDYILLSDQDDIWLPARATTQLQTLARLERLHGSQAPCLSHGDMELIAADDRRLAPSFFHRAGIRLPAPGHELAPLLAANFITGCTMACNRSLLELATPVPTVSRHHDHWIALCAATAGHIACEAAPLVRYRQHAGNTIGSPGASRLLRDPARLRQLWRKHRDDRARLPALIATLRERTAPRAGTHAAALLDAAAQALATGHGRAATCMTLLDLGIRPSGTRALLLWLLKNLLATARRDGEPR